jgi:hypothetical protein
MAEARNYPTGRGSKKKKKKEKNSSLRKPGSHEKKHAGSVLSWFPGFLSGYLFFLIGA